MPAKSKSQQKLFGQAYAYKTGKLKLKDIDSKYTKRIKSLANSMSEEELSHFAKTKHKNLPEKIKENKILDFNSFNESVLGDIQRLNPNRKKDDLKFSKLVEEIKKDFKKYDEDLKKVSIDEKKNIFNLLKIGGDYTLSYVFGRFHPINRNIFTGNKLAGDRRIKIQSRPFGMENNSEKILVSDEMSIPNFDRESRAILHVERDNYYISYDLANELFNFFVEYFNKKYPQLKDSRYKGSLSIGEIERGIDPVLKYISANTKDNKSTTVAIRKGDNVDEIKAMISNMTDKEYDEYFKKKQKEMYDPSKESDEIKDEIGKEIDVAFKNNDINLVPLRWGKYGFEFRSFLPGYEFSIEFRHETDISSNIRKALRHKEFSGYEGELVNVSDGYGNDTHKYYRVNFTK